MKGREESESGVRETSRHIRSDVGSGTKYYSSRQNKMASYYHFLVWGLILKKRKTGHSATVILITDFTHLHLYVCGPR